VLSASFTRNKICWDSAKIWQSTWRISQINHQFLIGIEVLWAVVVSVKERRPTNLWVKRSYPGSFPLSLW
jgi:hypothetical protein